MKKLQYTSLNAIMNWSVQYILSQKFSYNKNFRLVRIGDFLKRNKTPISIKDDIYYKRATIKVNNGGIFLRDKEIGKKIGTKKQFLINEGQFLLSKIDARNGAFGVVPPELEGGIITGNFWTFDVDYELINPYFLSLVTTTKEFISFCEGASNGTTNRHYLQEDLFLNVQIPLPTLKEQNRIVAAYNKKIKLAEQQEKESKKGLQFVSFCDVFEWGSDRVLNKSDFKSNSYKTTSFAERPDLAIEIFRGKSPKYDKNSKKILLNQKCNRWNAIELEHAKKVNAEWIESIDNKFFTQQKDIIINSTGEGTIGRASLITQDFEGLLYDSHILLLRTDKNTLSPEFFTILLNSSYGQSQIEKIKSAQSTKQTELGITNLKKIIFPLPSEDIQKKLILRIKEIRNKIKHLRQQAKENRQQAISDFENKIFEPCN